MDEVPLGRASAWRSLLPAALKAHVPGRETARIVFANAGWLLADKVLRALLGLLVGAWVARHLGPNDYGILAYALAFVALFQSFANVGADNIVIREIANRPQEAPTILGSALALRLTAGVACWLVAIAGVAVLTRGDRQIVTLTAVVGGVLVFQAADVVDLWFQSQSQSRRTVVAKLTVTIASAGLKVLLILAGAPLMAFAAISAVEAMAAALALAVAYRRLRAPGQWGATRNAARQIVEESWPLMLSGLSIMIYMRIDQLLVKELLSARQLGIYAAVLPISQYWQVLPLTIASSIAPFLARRKAANEEAYEQAVVWMFRAFFYSGLVAAGGTYALSGIFVRHVFGAEFVTGIAVADIHSLSNAFCFLGIAHTLWLTNARRLKVRMYGTVLAGAVSVALNLALLPTVGLVAVGYAAIAAQCTAAFLVNGLVDRRGFRLQIKAMLFQRL